MRIRKGDKVIIIAGKERHKVGVVEKILPKTNRAVITGLNIVKKHMKRSGKYPQGGIIDIPAAIHLSNLMILDPGKNKPTRIGYQVRGKDVVRVSKLTGEPIKETK